MDINDFYLAQKRSSQNMAKTSAWILAIIFSIAGVALIIYGIYINYKTPVTDDPNQPRSDSGYIFIIGGTIGIIFGWLWLFLTTRFKLSYYPQIGYPLMY